MIYILLIIVFYVVWLFSKSYSLFFYKSKTELLIKKELMISYLEDFEIKDITRFIKVFDYFMLNPNKFDGATIVKDLHTIYGYDAPAGNHDYAYIHNEWFTIKGFFNSYKIDYQYGKDMRDLSIPYLTAWSRVFALWFFKPLWYVYLILKKIKG